MNEVFSDDEEFQSFGQLWKKERQGFRKLTVSDVSKLLEFAKRIKTYRAGVKRESGRKRSNNLRKKLRKAAKDGDPAAVKKLKKVKKLAKKRAARSYKKNQGKNAV